MSTKVIINIFFTILLAITSIACESVEERKALLPECKVVYHCDNQSFDDIINNGRPKVVVYNLFGDNRIADKHLFNDIKLLKKQIAQNPEFDFIFYYHTNVDYSESLARIATENNLRMTLILDTQGKYATANEISKGIICVANIFDKKLRKHFSAVPGVGFSPFDKTMQKFKRSNNM